MTMQAQIYCQFIKVREPFQPFAEIVNSYSEKQTELVQFGTVMTAVVSHVGSRAGTAH